jgi:hypothetical protein
MGPPKLDILDYLNCFSYKFGLELKHLILSWDQYTMVWNVFISGIELGLANS